MLPDPINVKKEWSDDIVLLPDLTWPDIVNYLINTPSEYTRDKIRAYKSIEAYNFAEFFKFVLSQRNKFSRVSLGKKSKKSKKLAISLRNSKNSKKFRLIAKKSKKIKYKVVKLLNVLANLGVPISKIFLARRPQPLWGLLRHHY